VLALGALVTVIGGSAVLGQRSGIELEQAVFGLLSVGGALGFVGYVRAHRGVKDPGEHNVTATLLCLVAGVVAALFVAGYVAFGALDRLGSPWSSPMLAVPSVLFSAANLVWAMSGVAWMQRLPHRYAEDTGRPFDTLPAMLLIVAIMLTTAALLKTATL
jgi:hypothetical protein